MVQFSFLDIFDGQPVNQHNCLGIAQGNAPGIGAIPRELKSALLQTLVVQGKTYSLPVQKLNPVAPAADEDKNVPAAGVAPQCVLYQTRQPVEPFAHIGGLVVQVEPVG